MAQEAVPQQRQGLGAHVWWRLILGVMLLILNMVLYFESAVAELMGWRVPTGEQFFLQWLLYLLLCFLGFFFIGLMRGRDIRTARAAARLCLAVGLIGILPVMALSVIVGLVLVVLGSQEGVMALADATSLAPQLGGSEILAGVGGILLGRLIGNHFLRRRSDPVRAPRY